MIRLEQENNDTEFISCLLGEKFGEENRSGVPLKCFECQQWDSPFKSLGDPSLETEIVKTSQGTYASSQKNNLTYQANE